MRGVKELSLRDYKFYAKLVPFCFAVSERTESNEKENRSDLPLLLFLPCLCRRTSRSSRAKDGYPLG